MMTKQQAEQLIEQYLDGMASRDEMALVEQAYVTLAEPGSFIIDPLRQEAIKAGLRATLLARLPKPSSQPRVRKLVRVLPYAAAAVLLIVSVVGYFAVESQKWSVLPTGQAGESLAATEILPGGNRATLTLADGRVIDLSSEHEGIVVADGITYLDGSQVMENEELRMKNDRPTLNSITTPKGGTYQVTLPDGSKVWLNAGSTLKYPSRFSADVREVILEGEAYFDIVSMDRARNAIARERSDDGSRASTPTGSRASVMRAKLAQELSATSLVPFLVKTTTQTVEVLGTQFNISAYADEAETRTTLVEGSVLVRHGERSRTIAAKQKSVTLTPGTATGASVSLVPGEQATLTANGAITKAEVDVSQYTSWKDGEFNLDGVDFRETMRRLARWYDVDVVYDASVPDDLVSGGWISRDTPLSSVLKVIEQSGLVKFDVQGRTIYVSK